MTDIVPVFPLPNAVLFPRTVLPLHVFEPRYRSMVRDARGGDGRIAVALLAPGHEEDRTGAPPIHGIGTVGEMKNLRTLPGDRFLLDLVGQERVEFEEVHSDRVYRMARVRARPEAFVDEDDPGIQQGKLELLAAQGYLLRELSPSPEPTLILNDRLPFTAAINGACANLPADPEVRQRLLEEDDLVARQRTALSMTNALIRKILEFKSAPADEAPTRNLN